MAAIERQGARGARVAAVARTPNRFLASEQLSEEELRELVSTHDDLDEQERRILSDVFATTDTSIKEVMRPRGDVSFVEGPLTLAEAAQQVHSMPYSRCPVTGEDFDDIRGFLHVRDLLGPSADDPRLVSATTGDVSDIDGGASLEDFADHTGIKLRDSGYETVAGYVIALLGHIPTTGEQGGVEGGRLDVTEVVGHRITRLTLHRDS